MILPAGHDIVRTIVVGTAAYVALVALLRVSGKRTLSKLNAFDLVITVALGSTLAAAFVQRSVTLGEAVVAFALLVGLQFAVTWTTTHFPRLNRWIKAKPRLLYYDGRIDEAALKAERVTREELCSALRSQGIQSFDEVEAIVIESNADLACLRKWVPTLPFEAIPREVPEPLAAVPGVRRERPTHPSERSSTPFP